MVVELDNSSQLSLEKDLDGLSADELMATYQYWLHRHSTAWETIAIQRQILKRLHALEELNSALDAAIG